MKITVIAVGKLKEKYMSAAAAEYVKRLCAYARLDIIEVADEAAQENLSPAQEEQVRNREGGRILKNIKDNAYVIATAVEGVPISSEEFASKLAKLSLGGKSHFYFIIGGSLGLSQAVMERSDFSLSFSKMTFPHQLMRVLLLEQIYRAFRINNNEPYHK